MKINLTGATGFLGLIIKEELSKYFSVITIGRNDSDIIYNYIDDVDFLTKSDLFIHCAGSTNKSNHYNFNNKPKYDFNYTGTRCLLKSLEKSKAIPQKFIYISSVAVYGLNSGSFINETYDLKAKDIYGFSKISTENLLKIWCEKFNVKLTILRLPLIIGPNPKGNLFSLIQSIKKGYYFNIGGGQAKKSMVLATDVAKILVYASDVGGIYNLTDGYHPTFNEFSALINKQVGNENKIFNFPYLLFFIIAIFGSIFGSFSPFNLNKFSKLTSTLTFDDTKARNLLNWKPNKVLETFNIN